MQLVRELWPSDPIGILVFGIDARRRLLGLTAVSDPDVAALARCARGLDARHLVLASAIPPDASFPSSGEVDGMRALRGACAAAGIDLVDHVVMAGHHWWSCRELDEEVW